MEVTSEIVGIISDYSGIPAGKIGTDDEFREDLEFDQLDTISVVMKAEERFNIDISDLETNAISTVGDLVELVTTKRG